MNTTQAFTQVGSQSCTGTISQTYNNPSMEILPKKPECPKDPEYHKPPESPCQTHVHEFQGSTKLAEEREDRHNHRFAGVSSQVIPFGNSHVHGVYTNTDFFEEHYHTIAAVSGPAIPVGNGKHVHFAEFTTTFDDGHLHKFQFASLIEDPLT